MPLTSNGFNARRFVDIVDNMFESMATDLAIELDTSSNQVLSVITNIMASAITDIEELVQAVADNLNIDKAEGKYLDDLVALINLKRLNESYSTGVLHIKTTQNSSEIPSGTIFSDTQGFEYRSVVNIPVSHLACTEVELTPNIANGVFSITVDGVQHSITYGAVTPISAIVEGLYNKIVASVPVNYTVEKDGDILRVIKTDKSNSFSVIPNSNLSIVQLEVFGAITATEVGSIDPELNTITTITSTVTGVQSVTNYFGLTVGRNVETDEQLRVRHSNSTQISGSATPPAMYAKLSNIIGVSQVRVFENKTFSLDSSGLPPKSFECIVEGGDDQTIADTIYNTMPLGVESYGNITTIVKDYSGNNESVKWSRPDVVYINVKVTYSTYDEETFPDDGNNAIKKAIIETGNNLSLDEDVIPQRFIGNIYNSVEGLGPVTIEVGTSTNPSSVSPDNIGYQSGPISIDARSRANFDEVRIQLVEV